MDTQIEPTMQQPAQQQLEPEPAATLAADVLGQEPTSADAPATPEPEVSTEPLPTPADELAALRQENALLRSMGSVDIGAALAAPTASTPAATPATAQEPQQQQPQQELPAFLTPQPITDELLGEMGFDRKPTEEFVSIIEHNIIAKLLPELRDAILSPQVDNAIESFITKYPECSTESVLEQYVKPALAEIIRKNPRGNPAKWAKALDTLFGEQILNYRRQMRGKTVNQAGAGTPGGNLPSARQPVAQTAGADSRAVTPQQLAQLEIEKMNKWAARHAV